MKGLYLDGEFAYDFISCRDNNCKHLELTVTDDGYISNYFCRVLNGLPDPHNKKMWDPEKRVCKYYEPRE